MDIKRKVHKVVDNSHLVVDNSHLVQDGVLSRGSC
jgi:hypothetical protein